MVSSHTIGTVGLCQRETVHRRLLQTVIIRIRDFQEGEIFGLWKRTRADKRLLGSPSNQSPLRSVEKEKLEMVSSHLIPNCDH